MKNIEGIVIKNPESLYHLGKREGFKYRFNTEENLKFTSYESWSKHTGEQGIVLITDEGRRVNLAGKRVEEAQQKVDEDGYVKCEVSSYGKRFSSIKRVL